MEGKRRHQKNNQGGKGKKKFLDKEELQAILVCLVDILKGLAKINFPRRV